jgi:hypothetical protein
VRPSGPRASGSKRKLPESQVAETVKKLLLLKDSESDRIELDVEMSSDIEFESDSELEDVISDSDELENSIYGH